MSRLSIIVPAGDDTSLLEDTLVGVLSNRPRACEVIVPHASSYDDPYGLSEEVWFVDLPAQASTGECITAAMSQASGDVLHLLTPGCQVEAGWYEAALEEFEDPLVAAVSPALVLEEDGTSGNAVLGVQYGLFGRREVSRAVNSGRMPIRKPKILGPTHTCGFYRRTALRQAGGWPQRLDVTHADVDLALSLQQLGYRSIVQMQSVVQYSTGRSGSAAAYQRARLQERVFWRHAAARGWAEYLLHPVAALIQAFTAGGPGAVIGAGIGKLAGIADARHGAEHQRKLQQALAEKKSDTHSPSSRRKLRRAA